jgi:hypothetical protein
MASFAINGMAEASREAGRWSLDKRKAQVPRSAPTGLRGGREEAVAAAAG